MKRVLIAALVFCVEVPLVMGQRDPLRPRGNNVINTSRSNVKDNLISNGTSCTTIGITLDANFNVTGSTRTSTTAQSP
jgi:hypothetical protein